MRSIIRRLALVAAIAGASAPGAAFAMPVERGAVGDDVRYDCRTDYSRNSVTGEDCVPRASAPSLAPAAPIPDVLGASPFPPAVAARRRRRVLVVPRRRGRRRRDRAPGGRGGGVAPSPRAPHDRAAPRCRGRLIYASTMPAATVSFVPSSMRMNAPVARQAAYGSAAIGSPRRSRTRARSLSSSRSAGACSSEVTSRRCAMRVEPRADRAARVLEQVAAAGPRRGVAEPAERRVQLARRTPARRRRRRSGRRG